MVTHSKQSREPLINKALAAISSGQPYRAVVNQFKIQRATLHYRVHHYHNKKPCRRSGLTAKEEQNIVQLVLLYAERGTPLTILHLREAIKTFCAALPQSRLAQLLFKYETVFDT